MTRVDLNIDEVSKNPGDFFLKSASIEASAGTGKTYTIERIVKNLIEKDGNDFIGGKPVDISEILVVTFTNKAAGELKERIRSILKKSLDEISGQMQEVQSDESISNEQLNEFKGKEDRIRRALLDIDNASISTFHSFCRQVLHKYGFESGIPDGCELVDKDGLRNVIERRCRDVWISNPVFEKLLKNPDTKLEKGIIDRVWEIAVNYDPETKILIPVDSSGKSFEEIEEEIKKREEAGLCEEIRRLNKMLLEMFGGK